MADSFIALFGSFGPMRGRVNTALDPEFFAFYLLGELLLTSSFLLVASTMLLAARTGRIRPGVLYAMSGFVFACALAYAVPAGGLHSVGSDRLGVLRAAPGAILAVAAMAVWLLLPKLLVRSYFAWRGTPSRMSGASWPQLYAVSTATDAENRPVIDSDDDVAKIKHRLELILNSAGEAIFGLDRDGRVAFVNRAATDMFGWSHEDLIGQHKHNLLHHTRCDGTHFVESDCPIVATLRYGTTSQVEEDMFWRKDGTSFFAEYVSTPIIENGAVAGAVILFKDVTVRKQIKEERDRIEAFLRVVLDTIEDAVVACDQDGQLTVFNRAARELHGLPERHIPPDHWAQYYRLYHADGRTVMTKEDIPLFRALQGEAVTDVEMVIKTATGVERALLANGRPMFDGEGRKLGAAVSLHDVTQRRAYETQLEYQARHDPLTALPNRQVVQERIEHALALARRSAHLVAVLFLDLNAFKAVNDGYGHNAGDRLLQAVAERLRSSLRETDTVGRQGGDEFVIVLERLTNVEAAGVVARKLVASLADAFLLDEGEIFIGTSVGISIYPKDGEDAQELMTYADMALYRAKEQGQDDIQYFAADMGEKAGERVRMTTHLRYALNREEFTLHYQPQVDLKSGRIVGAEALLRWHSPEFGRVSPAEFIPIAEETGLIIPLGEWVLREACGQAKRWQEAGLPAVRVAVNLSVRQFLKGNFVDLVAEVLADVGLEPQYLELEITESLFMKDVHGAVERLQALKALGIHLAVDDFGTGYSSLSYLKRFPLDRLKIDRAFVNGITADPEDAAIALAVIAMARSLRLKVTAEGVESSTQSDFLSAKQCDEMQGYYFSPPVQSHDFTALLRDDRRLDIRTEVPEKAVRSVLIVDDDSETLSSLGRILERDGYHMLTADNAKEGLELLARFRIGVVISDYVMPGMNGAEMLRRVRELHPETVRILLTGRRDTNILLDAINRCGVYRFLMKPVSPDLLHTSVREAFLLHDIRRERAIVEP